MVRGAKLIRQRANWSALQPVVGLRQKEESIALKGACAMPPGAGCSFSDSSTKSVSRRATLIFHTNQST